MDSISWANTAVAVATVFAISRIIKLLEGRKAVNALPGLIVPFQPFSIPGVMFPESSWNPGLIWTWTWRKTRNLYERHNSDTVAIVPYLVGQPTIYTRNMDVGRQVVTAGHRTAEFGKTDSMSGALLFWGPSVVAVERETWRKHRRIVGPAFNNDTYSLVWNTSKQIYNEWIDAEGWTSKGVIDVPVMQALTFKFTLIIIATCGFGFPFSWVEPPRNSPGEMTLQESFKIISETTIFAVGAPKWAWYIPTKWVQSTRKGYDTMREFVKSQVRIRREEIRNRDQDALKRKDIFSLLLEANENEEGGKMALNEQELVGNVFALLFAGHETTAHTLAATLGFLSLDDDLQNEVVEQIREVTSGRPDGEILFEDYPRLDKVLAAFYEGVRMFPSGNVLVREAKQDTVLNLPKQDGEGYDPLPVKKGTHVIVDMVGVQYHPKYFAEPEEYHPSRWYAKAGSNQEDLSESEEYTAFSVGPRSCIGRKFATTEAVCLLSHMLRDWHVEPMLLPNETKAEYRERVMQGVMHLTMGIRDVPLRFSRRK